MTEISYYIVKINTRYKTGISTEHTYRGDLQNLLEALVTGIAATNEPQRISCGAPDYIITKKNIPVGYIEAKDIGADMNNPVYREQFDRYRASLNNLIITDYIDFRFYLDGDFTTSIRIAEIKNGKLVPIPENFAAFEALIKDFCFYQGQTIKSSRKLAEMMAAKARMLADVIEKALNSDEITQENSSLKDQFLAFRDILIHDIHNKDFADVYAQTIAYGMFAARLNDTSLDTFSRQEAATLIPKTNPFLRKLFQYIAGYDLDSRISWIVDGLADVFRATDVSALLQNFGNATQTLDPIIHFYETFLSEYDPKLRKARGVWYTPDPVVNFIVRAIDYILRVDFGILDGLADNSKIAIKVNVPGVKNLVEQQVHRVQFLDPTTGTGTFLAEIIKQIYAKFKGQEGVWSDYVEKHLIPRLNGFEILMASYAMAHLKLSMLLKLTGYVPKIEQRFRIYLTNSLEEHHPDTGTLFANWLSTEANEANHVKRDTPIMVVTGNPPYSVSSNNKSEWIESLTADYKKDLNERNIQPLSDDYIKFIRFGQHFIDKNKEGILAYITNNSFIDGTIHRQMRKHLLQSFDKIYILDLHGNAKKKEVCPDGSPDQNVFDIMQGVSINLFVKTNKKKKAEYAKVYYHSIHGVREIKYDFLHENSLDSMTWDLLEPKAPNYFFVKKNFTGESEYRLAIKLSELFNNKCSGVKTHRDYFVIDSNKRTLSERMKHFLDSGITDESVRSSFNLKDNRDWSLSEARKSNNYNDNFMHLLSYRPFDSPYIYYDKRLIDFTREPLMVNMTKSNLGLIVVAQAQAANLNYFDCVFISKYITDTNMFRRGGPMCFPLYIYPESTGQTSIDISIERRPNLNGIIIVQISETLGLTFTNEKEQTPGTFAPIDILDYIYAVLHSPTYREKYKEFLKIDFPRVPYPKDAATFFQLVSLGSELRQIHLLESPLVNKLITRFPVGGSNLVEKVRYEAGSVYVNDSQYFADVPQRAWEFFIGGYQPAQKWLKDRKGRELQFEDILHYQKVIVALTETDRLMKEIDTIDIE